ncbi:WecB/TagA/CpsF family glycosyltransferase [Ensifer soli]|uniref:WecB/TagA/CpsF family glycosyltransferase n=1 Tax=Ciceribacter sp. sgz301302 TaxID=3342379 RepID=UPI0035B8306E
MNGLTSEAAPAARRDILGVDVCHFGWADALAYAEDALARPDGGQTVIAFLNANNANLMMRDTVYRDILRRQTVLPDGHGVDIASLVFHGTMFPANLNGTDFVPALMTYLARPRRIAMIGARPEVLFRAAAGFRRHAPWHEFVPVADGFFQQGRADTVMEEVRQLHPDILLIAMGSPRQEKWIDRHVGPGHGRLVISVGALFDFMAGEVPRAPRLVRRLRFEWLFRLMIEPGRLWRRYILGNPLFLYYVLRHRLAGGEKVRPAAGRAGSRPV